MEDLVRREIIDDSLDNWAKRMDEEDEEEWWRKESLGPEVTGKEDDPTDSEEGEAPMRVRSKTKVTKEERENHELTHTPFRWWCRHCVRGRGRNKAHKCMLKKEELNEKKKQTPRVSIDYYFGSQEDEEAKTNTFIIMVC